MLEPQPAALAAVKRDGNRTEELDELGVLNDSMIGLAAHAYARVNSEFRARLYALPGQQRLCSIIRNLRLQADPYVSMLISGGDSQTLEYHREIRLVRAGEGALVEELTRQHVRHTMSRVMAGGDSPSPRRAERSEGRIRERATNERTSMNLEHRHSPVGEFALSPKSAVTDLRPVNSAVNEFAPPRC